MPRPANRKAKRTTKRKASVKRLPRRARRRAEDLLRFLDASPGAYHAVAALRDRFVDVGFEEIDESEAFDLAPGGRYVLRRHDAALLAFVAGTRAPSEAGFRLVGAHTDSPGLKLKPHPETIQDGLVRLGVEVYGGPILATWTDRDLGICGRVVVEGRGGRLETRLVRTGPMVVLPNVAIHLNRKVNDEGLKLNPQTELAPVLGTVDAGLPAEGAVRALIARELKVRPERILVADLFLFDSAPASFAGANDEFVRSGRLDDLAMCHAGTTALIETAGTAVGATRMLVCYDSEEVGSQTGQGARSNFLPVVLERVAMTLGDDREGYLRALAASFLVSADNAHARHPGYVEASEPQHAPILNGGPVLKVHASRAYATDAWSAAVFERACREAGVPCQRFVNRSDRRSGGTIGSMTAAQLGIPTADVGNAQLAMHSIREMAGTLDHDHMIEAMTAYLSSDGE